MIRNKIICYLLMLSGIWACSESKIVLEHTEEISAVTGYSRHVDLTELLLPNTVEIKVENEPTIGSLTLFEQFNGHVTAGFYISTALGDPGGDSMSIVAINSDGDIIARKTVEVNINPMPLETDPYGYCQGNLYGESRIHSDSVLTIDLMDNAILCNIGKPIEAHFSYAPKEEYDGLAFYVSKNHQIMLYQHPVDSSGKVEFDYEICYVFTEDLNENCTDPLNECPDYPESTCQVFIESSVVIDVFK